MFSKDDEEGRHDHHNSTEVKFRFIEGRHSKPRRCFYGRKIDNPHKVRKDIARYDTDEDWNNTDKTAAQNRCQYGYDEGKRGNNDGRFVAHALGFTQVARHSHGQGSQLQADNSYDSTHRCRWKENINPLGSYLIDDEGQYHKGKAEDNEPALGIAIGHPRCGTNCQDRRNESKTGAQISRQAPFTNGQVQECANAIHKKGCRRIYVKQKRHQYGRTKHSK